MTKEQQIEEIENVMCSETNDECIPHCNLKGYCSKCKRVAEALYNAGYRKVPKDLEISKLLEDLYSFDKFARQISKTRIELTGEAVPTCKTLLKYIDIEKSKAVKDFSEKLKAKCNDNGYWDGDSDDINDEFFVPGEIGIDDIDELLKDYEK